MQNLDSRAFNKTANVMCSAMNTLSSNDVLDALMRGLNKKSDQLSTLESIAVALYTYWDGVYSQKLSK